MRILMVVRPAAGGMKGHVLELAAGLVDAGHVVEVAAPGGSDVARQARDRGLAVHEIPLVGPLRPAADPRAVAALSGIVRRGGFDLVHAHGFKAGLVGRLAARFGGCKTVVLTAHNHVLERDDTSAAARRRYRAVERALSRYVTRYIAVSDSICRELVEGYGLPAAKVSVVRNGVDPAPFLTPHDRTAVRAGLGLPADATVAGLAARFSAQKGLVHLLDAVPLMRAERPDLLVVIGGEGPLEGDLRERAVAVSASGSVRWPGYIADIPAFLSALDVYISPAETEALGIALIEASLACVPVVATDVGGVPEVVVDGETGVLVPRGDSAALARATLALLRDRDRAAALAGAARERCLREFAPARMVELTLGVYTDALAQSSGATG